MIYTIVTYDELHDTLPSVIIDYMGYDDWDTLNDKALVIRELENGNFAISVNLKGSTLNKASAWSDLTDHEINLAKNIYGEENLLTQEEYNNLKFKTEIE